MKSYSILEINSILQGEIVGQTDVNVTSPEQLELATVSQISFIGNKKYEKLWENSNASIAVVKDRKSTRLNSSHVD